MDLVEVLSTQNLTENEYVTIRLSNTFKDISETNLTVTVSRNGHFLDIFSSEMNEQKMSSYSSYLSIIFVQRNRSIITWVLFLTGINLQKSHKSLEININKPPDNSWVPKEVKTHLLSVLPLTEQSTVLPRRCLLCAERISWLRLALISTGHSKVFQRRQMLLKFEFTFSYLQLFNCIVSHTSNEMVCSKSNR